LFLGFVIIAFFCGINGYVGYLGVVNIAELDDPEKLEDEMDKMLGTMVLLSSISVIVAMGIGLIISSSIGIPLKKFEISANEVSKGNLDTKISYKKNNEFGEFSNTFNSMIDSIKRNIDLEKDLVEDKLKNEKLTAIGKMASRLAHDLRNPLSIISNEIEVIQLRDPNPNEKMQKSQDRICRAIQRMTRQLEDVMDFVRTKPLDIKNQSMRNLISSSIKSLTIPSEIKINLPENDYMITCDSIQMGIVFNNLIYNSIQAMENSGEINVIIFDNLENTVIEFQDSGPGIPEKNLETIFEPLFTTKQTGTGLGLVSCRTIVKQHGGTISVKNNPTTFTVMIPKIIKKVEQVV